MRMTLAALLGLHAAAWLVVQQASATPWEPHFLYEYPTAVCNDGSPAAYYYRAGQPDQRQWLVFLEGAGWCWGVKSCSLPWHKRLGTSLDFPRTKAAVETWAQSLQGIFDDTGDSPFQDMNIAYIRSCSNDAFMGDTGPEEAAGSKPVASWHFRGVKIVEATFADLRNRTGLGDRVGDRVVLGGCSSGSLGATVLLDHAATALAGLAHVAGLLDSGLWLPLRPRAPGLVSMDEQTRLAFALLKPPEALLGEACSRRHPGAERWRCLGPAYRLPFVQSPFFLAHSQYDAFGVSMNIFGRFDPAAKLDEPQRRFAERYRREVVKYLPTPPPGSGSAVFSPACFAHCVLSSGALYGVRADGVALLDALRRWLSADSAQAATRSIRESCSGFDCGRVAPPRQGHGAPAGPAAPAAPAGPAGPARPARPRSWQPRFLTDYPLACCNDGSVAAYYYRPGAVHRRKWLVFLEGGGWCWDAKSCSLPLHKRLGTSNGFPRTPADVEAWSGKLKGVLENSDRGPFKDWHIAYVRACSNDAFLGDLSPREVAAAQRHEPGRGWHFRGRRIVEATLKDLRRRTGLGEQSSDLLLYGGRSSGGRGALVTLDLISTYHAGGARVVGLFDAPLDMPIQPMYPDLDSFDDKTRKAFALANTSGALGSPECEAAHPGAQRWKCLGPSHRLPFVRTPYFLAQSQYDSWGITQNIFGVFLPMAPMTEEQQAYAERYRREALRRLPHPSGASGVAVFSPARYLHCMLSEDSFYGIDAAGVPLQAALRSWLATTPAYATTEDLRDTCRGFDCGHGRRRHAAAHFAPRTVSTTPSGRQVLEAAAALLV